MVRGMGDQDPRVEPGHVLSAPARDRILQAALEEFASKGFEGTTTAAVARSAGVTQPLVHYHFESKDELWRMALGRVIEHLATNFGGVRNELSDLSAVDQLKVIVRRLVYFSASHPELGRILAYEGATGGERLDWLLEQQAVAQAQILGELIQASIDSGQMKPLPAAHVATCVGAMSAYLFVVRATMRDLYGIDVEDPRVVECHADTVVELFFNGVLVTPIVDEESERETVGRGVA